jgi:hypothetical protein
MFRFLKIIILPACLLVVSGELSALTPAEADAIIMERELAKAESKAARKAELERAELISEGEATLPNGQKVIIREVKPPSPAELTSSVKRTSKAGISDVSAEQLAFYEARAKVQQRSQQMLSCTVYDRAITQLRWTHEGENYLAYTNADFNYLRSVSRVETESTQYNYFMGIGNVSSVNATEPLPDLPAFDSKVSQYYLAQGRADIPQATAGLEALLAYYDTHLDSLKIVYQRNEALAAAQKRYDAKHPAEKEEFILQFWVPKKGSKR